MSSVVAIGEMTGPIAGGFGTLDYEYWTDSLTKCFSCVEVLGYRVHLESRQDRKSVEKVMEDIQNER